MSVMTPKKIAFSILVLADIPGIGFGVSLLVFLGALLTASLASTEDAFGQQLTRQRAFELVSAELRKRPPLTYRMRLHTYNFIRTSPNINLDDTKKRLEEIIKLSGDDFERLKKTDRRWYMEDAGVYEMRKLWIPGKMSHIKWEQQFQSFQSFWVLQPIAILTTEAARSCDVEPYVEGNDCIILTGTRSIVKVTGIRDQGDFMRVEFDTSITPTLAGTGLGIQSAVKSGTARLVLYDDGWRVSYVDFPSE